jgi:hypothetical protein
MVFWGLGSKLHLNLTWHGDRNDPWPPAIKNKKHRIQSSIQYVMQALPVGTAVSEKKLRHLINRTLVYKQTQIRVLVTW